MVAVDDLTPSTGPTATGFPPLVGTRLRRIAPALIIAEVVLILLFGVLFWHSTKGDSLDRTVGDGLYAASGSMARGLFSAISLLGSPGVVVAASVVVGLTLWLRFRNVLLALFCPFAVTLATIAESVVKGLVRRSRPTTAGLLHLQGRSFPPRPRWRWPWGCCCSRWGCIGEAAWLLWLCSTPLRCACRGWCSERTT
jgi:hypothetical protein